MKHVRLQTNKGNIILELDDAQAPNTVNNFLDYVHRGHYNGTIFHRVIDGFMIQGGGMLPGLKQKDTLSPIPNEANNGLKNDKYTIAMARTNDPHSATAQFFINVNDNNFLNHSSQTLQGWGYCVFGKVVSGFPVVDEIRRVKTGSKGFHQDVPLEDVVILDAYVSDAEGYPVQYGEQAETEEEAAARKEAEQRESLLRRSKGYVITDHLVEGAATQVVLVVGDDANENTGANHLYSFSGFNTDTNPSAGEGFAGQRLNLHLLFQNGVVPVVGENGVTIEAVLAACSHRLSGFQAGPFACQENQEAMEHINLAIESLQKRTRARIAREVEGTNQL